MSAAVMLLALAGCSDDDVGTADGGTNADTGTAGDTGTSAADGVCVRDEANVKFCINYEGIPADSAAAVESGCSSSWGGAWTTDGSCIQGTLVGTCTLSGDATGGATSAVMNVYEPTDATSAENDICGSDGTWTPAG